MSTVLIVGGDHVDGIKVIYTFDSNTALHNRLEI